MKVLIIVLLASGYDGRGRNGRLGHLLGEHSPIIFLLAEVGQSVLGHAVRYANVNAVGREHAVHLVQHGLAVRSRVVAAEDGIEAGLVDHSVEA